MLSKSNLEEILHIALSTGGDFADIFIEDSNGTIVACEDNKIERITTGNSHGAGVRVIKDKVISYSSTSKVTLSELKKTAKQAASAFSGSANKKSFDLIAQVPQKGILVKRRPHEVPIEEKVALVKTLNNTARSYGDKIKQVTVRYIDSNQAISIANSDGIYVEDNRIRTRYFLNVIAAKDHTLQTGYEAPGGTCGFELIEEYNPEEKARQATERALLMLDAPHAPAGRMMVVLHSTAGGTMVHEACGHALEADFIYKGTSIYGNNIGKKVASDLVTVIDDGTIPGKYGTYNFDDEGTPGQKTTLIENGILKGFMSDKYNAKLLGIKQSGNGRRESYHNKPIPRMTNTIIAPGKTDPDEIVASIKNGLLVKHMGGGEVNVTNGDFVFDVTEGYIIEDGKVKHPVRGAIITGNGPKVLQIIDMVGTDLGYQTGVCGKYDHAPVGDAQPTIRIPEIVVGGR
ncbi:MAG: TldD/PmbA family protein [Candidatus Saganbacteria bacterium]|nr:TldD/PmbA family protein [Candidatus Saganbacteria bacterium]